MDWLSRTELLLGEERLGLLKNAHVLVAGLGGVGAYAAEQLCRAGIGEMTIIDGDCVENCAGDGVPIGPLWEGAVSRKADWGRE